MHFPYILTFNHLFSPVKPITFEILSIIFRFLFQTTDLIRISGTWFQFEMKPRNPILPSHSNKMVYRHERPHWQHKLHNGTLRWAFDFLCRTRRLIAAEQRTPTSLAILQLLLLLLLPSSHLTLKLVPPAAKILFPIRVLRHSIQNLQSL